MSPKLVSKTTDSESMLHRLRKGGESHRGCQWESKLESRVTVSKKGIPGP